MVQLPFPMDMIFNTSFFQNITNILQQISAILLYGLQKLLF